MKRKASNLSKSILETSIDIPENDDELEMNKSRMNASLQGKTSIHSSDKNPISIVDSAGPINEKKLLSNAALAEMYARCTKLSAQGKINTQNTWSLDLIDHMDDLIADNRAATDFQRASAAIDAGVQIYSSRVDSVHDETYRVLSTLSKDVPETDAQEIGPKEDLSEKNRLVKRKGCEDYTAAPETLTSDTFGRRPVCAALALPQRLCSEDGAVQKLQLFTATLVENNSESVQLAVFVSECTANKLCTQSANTYHLAELVTPVLEYLEKTETTVLKEEFVQDMDQSAVLEESAAEALPEEPHVPETTRPLATLALSQPVSHWAGAGRSEKGFRPATVSSAAKQKRKRAKVIVPLLDFSASVSAVEQELLATIEKKPRKLVLSALSGHTHLLPEDLHLQPSLLQQLFCVPRRVQAPVTVSDAVSSGAFSSRLPNNKDRSLFDASSLQAQSLAVSFQQSAAVDKEEKEPMPELEFNLVAKHLDVASLKRKLWRLLTESVTDRVSFCTLVASLCSAVDEEHRLDITKAYCFVCVLHLANENGLELVNTTTDCADFEVVLPSRTVLEHL